MNQEHSGVQDGFGKSRGIGGQIANKHWIKEKARELQKNIYFCFIDYSEAFFCVDHNKLWKIIKEMGIPDHLTCLLRNLYTGQEAAVRTRHGKMDWFKIGRGVRQGYILSLCLFNLYVSTSCKMPGGWITSWNQDCQEKYQKPQICRWHHPYRRKWRTKKPLDENERGEWKSWLKAHHSEN